MPPDTTQVDFVEAYHNVRIYKSDVQVLCDSLLFNSIDSIARLFDAPVLWYEIESQITADSMQFLMRNGTLDKGLLFANCFVISEEEPGQYYHQIKSPEMIGYFKDLCGDDYEPEGVPYHDRKDEGRAGAADTLHGEYH